jgi:hypothetical protein
MWSIHSSNRFCSRRSSVNCPAPLRVRWCLLSILLAALLLSPGFPEPSPLVGVLSYKADGAGADKAAALYASIMALSRNETAFKTIRKNTNTIQYEYDTAETPSAPHLSWYTIVCGQLRCSFLLMGRFYQRNGTTYIETRLFSAPDKKFVFTATEPINFAEDHKKAANLIVKRLSLFYSGKLPFITNLKASRGTSFKQISLSWTSTPAADSALISRSQYEYGDFIKIGETESNSFNDTSALEGIKYWYQVCGVSGGTPGASSVDFGYRKPEIPKGLTVSDMLDARDKPRQEPATPDERRKEKLHLRLFEKYYESYLMATFISIVGRFYINSGELLAYRDIRIQSWDPGNRTIYFEKPGIFAARFFSRRFFRFIRDMHDLHIPYDELLPRTIKNAVIFCIPSGEKEIREPDGRYRYIPNLEAVALGTEYTRDYEYWKSNTIFFATSEEGIYKRIREVQMRGY